MKSILASTFSLTLFGFLALAATAQGAVLEVNQNQSRVYFHPTPYLEVGATAVEGGGLLSLSIEYRSNQDELAALKKQYPGYELHALTSKVKQATAHLSIPQVGLEADLPVRQGQLGPFLNAQIALSSDQSKKIRALKTPLANLIRVSLPVSTSFNSPQIVEQYTADLKICSNLNVSNVKSMITGLLKWKKPDAIKSEKTFIDLKVQMLERCYMALPGNTSSLAGVLALPVSPLQLNQPLVAVGLEDRLVTKDFEINPIILVDITQ